MTSGKRTRAALVEVAEVRILDYVCKDPLTFGTLPSPVRESGPQTGGFGMRRVIGGGNVGQASRPQKESQ